MMRAAQILAIVLAAAVALMAAAPATAVDAEGKAGEPSGGGGTITLSTYVFALIAVGSCIVGSVFSFVVTKIIDTIKEP